MKTSIKKLCIFGLAAGIGRMILDQCHKYEMTEQERIMTIENAIALRNAGQKAIDTCKVKVDKSKIRQAQKKIDQVCRDHAQFDVAVMLSFLFLGLNDLSLYSSDPKIKDVEDAALNFLTIYDPNLEDDGKHTQAMKDYDKWAE